MVTVLIALLLASGAVLAVDVITFKGRMVDNLSMLSDVIIANSTAAITFNDNDAAQETLTSLKTQSNIMEVAIFSSAGTPFARYALPSRPQGKTQQLISEENNNRRPFHRFGKNSLTLYSPIHLNREWMGTLVIVSDLKELQERFQRYIWIGSIVLLASLGIGFLFSIKLQKIISDPVMDLVSKMRHISKEKIFSIRAVKSGNDEIGVLIDGFNGMLAQIQDRDDKLEQHRNQLEQTIAQRTQAMVEANEALALTVEELKQAKDVAEQSSLAKSQFLANMSHELRTPLNHIIGFTELVADRHFGDLNDIQAEYLSDVLTSSRHLLSLINDVLDLSKVEAGKMELELSKVDMIPLLERSLVMIKEKAIKHGIRLETEFCDDITILADERKLKQILYNLLSNAVKFTPDGGVINLTSRMTKSVETEVGGLPTLQSVVDVVDGDQNQELTVAETLEISVSDTGIGLEAEALENIFGRFIQADGSSSRGFQGTGIGLSLTRSLVTLHGGKIWAESKGVNKGSRFRFMLPVSPSDEFLKKINEVNTDVSAASN